MITVLICAIGVGGATMVGAVIGFIFRRASLRHSDAVLSLAAGVSLAAAVLGLILPSLECEGGCEIISVLGIFAGGVCVALLDKLLPLVKRAVLPQGERNPDGRAGRVLLFVMAIALHNLPEGIAAGVGFGSENVSDAVLIALGIALQNLPEGMVIIAPMLSLGIPPLRTLLCALGTGAVEIVGTVIGYLAVNAAQALLPFSLAFAGGTMLYVTCHEMIPETHSKRSDPIPTYCFLAGFSIMLLLDGLLEVLL